MFFVFSDKLGCFGSLFLSAVLTLIALVVVRSCGN